jgi:hypothetical protein
VCCGIIRIQINGEAGLKILKCSPRQGLVGGTRLVELKVLDGISDHFTNRYAFLVCRLFFVVIELFRISLAPNHLVPFIPRTLNFGLIHVFDFRILLGG